MLKNQKGFTLIEMLIVLLIITVLILVTLPNIGQHFKTIDAKGCAAHVQMVQGQVEAYRVDYIKYPTLNDLSEKKYITADQYKCPDGTEIAIEADGKVVAKGQAKE